MRVIGGNAKGKRLGCPNVKGNIRPLSEQVREALFNILMPVVDGARFLDLFAGTGAVGIEALSRGAKLAFFAEHDRRTVNFIRANLAATGFTEQAEVYALLVNKALNILTGKGAQFDIIFLGAPYDDPALEEALKVLGDSALIAPKGIVIAEHRTKHPLDEVFGALKRYRRAKYGDTTLSFYE